jgi:hypothetical protein
MSEVNEVVVACMQHNYDSMVWNHEQIIKSLEKEVAELRDEIKQYHLREVRMLHRMNWLMGYEED